MGVLSIWQTAGCNLGVELRILTICVVLNIEVVMYYATALFETDA